MRIQYPSKERMEWANCHERYKNQSRRGLESYKIQSDNDLRKGLCTWTDATDCTETEWPLSWMCFQHQKKTYQVGYLENVASVEQTRWEPFTVFVYIWKLRYTIFKPYTSKREQKDVCFFRNIKRSSLCFIRDLLIVRRIMSHVGQYQPK